MLPSFDFDTVPERFASECAKWHFFEDDVLPMWVADMDFKSPPAVIEALQDRVAHGVFGYPGKVKGLTEAILGWLETRYHWKVQAEHLVFLPGVAVGFNLAIQALTENNKAILTHTPIYPPFLKVGEQADRPMVESQLVVDKNNRYQIDFDQFEKALEDDCGTFLLCNPHNPTGRVFEKAELTRMAEACLRNQIVICSDEIHCDLIFSGNQHIPIASLDPEIAAKTVTLLAPSKTFNVPGLGFSFAVIADDDLRKRFVGARKGISGGVNILGMVAAKAAYTQGGPWLEALLGYLESNRDFLYQFVRQRLHGVDMTPSEGTYLAWLDCRGAGLGEDPCSFFSKQAKVGLFDGRLFGSGGEGHVRLNFGCPRSLLVEGLERMAAALEQNQR